MHDIAIFETLLSLFGQAFLRPRQFSVEPDVVLAEQRVLDDREIRGMIEVARRDQARVALHHAELSLALDDQRDDRKADSAECPGDHGRADQPGRALVVVLEQGRVPAARDHRPPRHQEARKIQDLPDVVVCPQMQ